MPRGLTGPARTLAATLLAAAAFVGLQGPARAASGSGGGGEPVPLRAWLDAHPGTGEEDLLDVWDGDSIDRVLAVIHNPESGLDPSHVRVVELGSGPAVDRDPASFAGPAGAGARGTWLVTVTQECDQRVAPAAAPASWLFLRDNRLVAWDLQIYTTGCRVDEERHEASDHDAMRVVGEELFRRQGQGRFRYGLLRYTQWDEAFAAPTREATLSLLREQAARAPEDAGAQLRLAVALHAAGERDAARERLERAAALAPGAPEPHRNLARLHRQRGDREAAAREEALAAAMPGAAGSAPDS